LHRAHASGFCSALQQLSHIALGRCFLLLWHRSRPLRPPSLPSGVSRHPCQSSSPVGQRSCQRGSDVKTSGTASSHDTSPDIPRSFLQLTRYMFLAVINPRKSQWSIRRVKRVVDRTHCEGIFMGAYWHVHGHLCWTRSHYSQTHTGSDCPQLTCRAGIACLPDKSMSSLTIQHSSLIRIERGGTRSCSTRQFKVSLRECVVYWYLIQ